MRRRARTSFAELDSERQRIHGPPHTRWIWDFCDYARRLTPETDDHRDHPRTTPIPITDAPQRMSAAISRADNRDREGRAVDPRLSGVALSVFYGDTSIWVRVQPILSSDRINENVGLLRRTQRELEKRHEPAP